MFLKTRAKDEHFYKPNTSSSSQSSCSEASSFYLFFGLLHGWPMRILHYIWTALSKITLTPTSHMCGTGRRSIDAKRGPRRCLQQSFKSTVSSLQSLRIGILLVDPPRKGHRPHSEMRLMSTLCLPLSSSSVRAYSNQLPDTIRSMGD